jgi:hypothetical protein
MFCEKNYSAKASGAKRQQLNDKATQFGWFNGFSRCRLSGLENELLGLNSRVNAVLWSRSSPEIEHIDVICFGHLLFEMCAGYELASPSPSKAHLEVDLERYPQVLSTADSPFTGKYRFPSSPFICIISFSGG